jgi:hypothetical protein
MTATLSGSRLKMNSQRERSLASLEISEKTLLHFQRIPGLMFRNLKF